MRIALISKWLARENDRFGGDGGFVQQLAEALLDRGHEVVALSQRKGATGGGLVSIGRVPTLVFDAEKRAPLVGWLDKALKRWSGSRKIVTDALEIRRFLATHGPFDVVWAQAEDPDGTACGVAARLGKIPPLVITVQAVRWREDSGGSFHFTQQRSLGIGFSRATIVAANSPLSAQWLREEYGVPEEKIGSYRVNLIRSFLEKAAALRGVSAGESVSSNRILFFGALNPTKAPDLFLEAARQLATRHKEWEFIVTGGETEKNRAFSDKIAALQAAPELQGRLTFGGALTREGVIDEIMRARLVVCPSRIDTLSRATVESLALGRPVVVSERVGARSLIESARSGLVAQCEPGALAAAIERVANEPSFITQAQAQAGVVAANHSPEQAAEILEELFKRASNT